MVNRDFHISDLPRLVLVQNAEKLAGKLQDKYPEKTFNDIISEHCDMSHDIFENCFSDGVSFRNERNFHSLYDIAFRIFTRNQTQFATKRRSDIELIHDSIFEKHLNLEFIGKWPDRSNILPTDKFRSHPQEQSDFIFPYDYCEYSKCRKNDFDKHVQTCSNITEIEYTQEKMTIENMVRQYLIKHEYLDAEYRNRMFRTYDIESLASKENARDISDFTSIISEQRIVTVAFHTNFCDGNDQSYLFPRESYSRESYKNFFRKIIEFLNKIGEDYQKSLPIKISQSISILEAKQTEIREKLKLRDPNDIMQTNEFMVRQNIPSFKEQLLIKGGLKYLIKLQKLRIYGFNSERYDLPILLPGLLSVLKLNINDVKSIKRGTGLMSVYLNLDGQFFTWLDCRNYLAGGSLAQFGRLFGGDVDKGTFCYEYFETIEQAKASTS